MGGKKGNDQIRKKKLRDSCATKQSNEFCHTLFGKSCLGSKPVDSNRVLDKQSKYEGMFLRGVHQGRKAALIIERKIINKNFSGRKKQRKQHGKKHGNRGMETELRIQIRLSIPRNFL